MYSHTIDEVLMENADVFIDQWSKEYNDEPETSWDDIFGRVLDEFMRYVDDEASANEEGYTIQERRDLNMLDDYDIRTEFNEFVRWLDLSDFDTEENINASRGDKNMKKFIKANREMPFGRKAAPKRAIKAFEYDYDENDEEARYEAEYATIEYATEGVDELSAWVDALKAGIEEYKQEYEPWGGDTSDWEMFVGPDDAETFGEQVREVKDEIINLSRKLGDVLNVYIYPDEFYK